MVVSNKVIAIRLQLVGYLVILFSSLGSAQSHLPNTQELTDNVDLSELMIDGIDKYLTKHAQQIQEARGSLWDFDFSSIDSFNNSIQTQRSIFSERLGVVDNRSNPTVVGMLNDKMQMYRIESEEVIIKPLSWEVLNGFHAEGLMIQPKGEVKARIILLPDADTTPEEAAGVMSSDNNLVNAVQTMVGAGCEVLVVQLVNRQDTYSGSELVGKFTNQPHREWLYRQGYEVGRHIIGYEIQSVMSAVDLLLARNVSENQTVPIGLAGHGEGGLLALYTAALDTRIASTLVSGYFDRRERLWQEPIYRNVFGLLKHFGDAEIAMMCWPRTLVIEPGTIPTISGPPPATSGRAGAAPGELITPEYSSVAKEVARARELVPKELDHIKWINNLEQESVTPFSKLSITNFLLGIEIQSGGQTKLPIISDLKNWIDSAKRQERIVRGIERNIQQVLETCEITRNRKFWEPLANDLEQNRQLKSEFRQHLAEQIGVLPPPTEQVNVRARLLKQTELWSRYEIVLDVWQNVFAWGILVVPKDISKNEQRPVVVCQHGLEGLPIDIVTNDSTDPKYATYQGLATTLAEKGYITFSPHNPYRGKDAFRVLQRKANPLGVSLFSIIIGQHQQILNWLRTLEFVDADRIGFYGLSYGGKTAMRVPAIVEGYALSICSGDFNEWVKKNASVDYGFSYMFHGEYEMPEWDLGHTFNYAEMAALIAPRPFMVERGHSDGVAIDEWVAYEFAKVRRHYDQIGIPGNCSIEYFNGGHKINGVGTFQFLDQHLWNK